MARKGKRRSQPGSVTKTLPWVSTCWVGLAWEVGLKKGRGGKADHDLEGKEGLWGEQSRLCTHRFLSVPGSSVNLCSTDTNNTLRSPPGPSPSLTPRTPGLLDSPLLVDRLPPPGAKTEEPHTTYSQQLQPHKSRGDQRLPGGRPDTRMEGKPPEIQGVVTSGGTAPTVLSVNLVRVSYTEWGSISVLQAYPLGDARPSSRSPWICGHCLDPHGGRRRPPDPHSVLSVCKLRFQLSTPGLAGPGRGTLKNPGA